MKGYKYVLTRKCPFIKQKELTEIEMAERVMSTLFMILPVILFVSAVYRVLYKLKVIR